MCINQSSVRRACSRAAARGGSCVVHDGKVAMLAWELKWTLSGDRFDFEFNMAFPTCSAIRAACDARARGAACGGSCQ
eukprot:9473090-Pyramimonas_sp.AAC.1